LLRRSDTSTCLLFYWDQDEADLFAKLSEEDCQFCRGMKYELNIHPVMPQSKWKPQLVLHMMYCVRGRKPPNI